jgi:hypothetical protein
MIDPNLIQSHRKIEKSPARSEFVLYVLPGFIALEIFHAFYPIRERSDIIHISWSIVYGLMIASLIKLMDARVLSGWLHSSDSGIPSTLFTLSLVVAGILVGLARSLLHLIRFRLGNTHRLKFLLPDPQTIWAKVNHPSVKDWAVVYLDDGSIYMGYIKSYTNDPRGNDQDFLLSGARRIADDLSTQMQSESSS